MQKNSLVLVACAVMIAFGISGCASKPKNKCNTCPKWRSALTVESTVHLA